MLSSHCSALRLCWIWEKMAACAWQRRPQQILLVRSTISHLHSAYLYKREMLRYCWIFWYAQKTLWIIDKRRTIIHEYIKMCVFLAFHSAVQGEMHSLFKLMRKCYISYSQWWKKYFTLQYNNVKMPSSMVWCSVQECCTNLKPQVCIYWEHTLVKHMQCQGCNVETEL